MRALLLKPAGAVYHDTFVREHHHDSVEHLIRAPTNTGDFFVHDATLKLLNYDTIESVPYRQRFEPHEIDRYNREFEVAIIRGSNYLHPHYDFGDILPILEQLTIPVVAFSFGCQAATYEDVQLPPNTMRALHIIRDHSVSIGVRGHFTADVLHRLGFHNVRPIGCPSIFRNNWPTNPITLQPLECVREVGLTTHRGLVGEYSQHPERTKTLQKDLITYLAQHYHLRIITQGEQPEKILYYHRRDLFPEALQSLVADGWVTGADDPFYHTYVQRLFFGANAEAYARLARTLDLAIGVRLHGNVMALGNGVPAIYLVYDTRTREFAELLGIPHYDVMSERPFRLEEFYQQDQFDRFSARYQDVYQDMAAFLHENHVRHRMQAAR
jgi:hypothetical protein